MATNPGIRTRPIAGIDVSKPDVGVPLAQHLISHRTSQQYRRRFEETFAIAEATIDCLTIVFSAYVGKTIYPLLGFPWQDQVSSAGFLFATLGFTALFLLSMNMHGAYLPGGSLLRVRDTERILRACTYAAMAAFVSAIALHKHADAAIAVTAWPFSMTLVGIQKVASHAFLRFLHARGHGVRRAIIYGSGVTGRKVYSAVCRSPKMGLEPVLLLDDDPSKDGAEVFESSYQRRRSLIVNGGPISQDVLVDHNASAIIIAVPQISPAKFLEIVSVATAADAEVYFVPMHSVSDYLVNYVDVDGLMLAEFSRTANWSPYDIAKRGFDFLAASLLALAFSPVLLAIFMAVKLTSQGPAIFVQERVGKNGAKFRMYKFRTMYVNSPKYSRSPVDSEDRRITRVGRLLRRSSLDELPQLFNVIKGDMSLVGPRPEMPFIVEKYGAIERQRLEVIPGITGLWQLSADRAYLIHENLEYDLYYIRNRSFFMDIAILLHTLIFAARGI